MVALRREVEDCTRAQRAVLDRKVEAEPRRRVGNGEGTLVAVLDDDLVPRLDRIPDRVRLDRRVPVRSEVVGAASREEQRGTRNGEAGKLQHAASLVANLRPQLRGSGKIDRSVVPANRSPRSAC